MVGGCPSVERESFRLQTELENLPLRHPAPTSYTGAGCFCDSVTFFFPNNDVLPWYFLQA